MKSVKSSWLDEYPKTTNPLKFLWFVSKPHRAPMAIALGAVTLASILSAAISYAFKYIASAAALLPAPSAYHELLIASGAYILVRAIGELLFRMSGFAGARWATGVRATSRQVLSEYVTLHSRGYFSDRFAGSISNKIGHASNDTRAMIEEILWQFLPFIVSSLTSFVIAYLVDPLLACMFVAWVLSAFLLNTYFARKRVSISAATQVMETALNGSTVDLLSNITAMQEYARRFFEIDRLKSMIRKRQEAGLRNWQYGERVLVVNGLIQALFSALIIFMAVHLTEIGAIPGSDVILIITLIFTIESQMLFLGSHLNSFGEHWGEITESLEEVLEPHEIPDPYDAQDLSLPEASIDFDAVTFAYGGNTVFDNLDLHIAPGERVGLVGRSGAGKSTLVRLLMHHHGIQSGEIRIGGVNIASVRQDSLREQVAIVPQESVLFHRTIRENIAYGKPDASEEDITHAAALAQSDAFIRRLPEGYESMVGERGVKLSGGERQRIAIARAILKNAPILLMDEATSALDSESEVAIQRALHALMEGKTVIAIAHRLSTLREMDRIIVMEQGKIVEEGTHDELVRAGGVYAGLWNHQAGGFLQDDE
jgi:ATP-binding cassette subfamily B protein